MLNKNLTELSCDFFQPVEVSKNALICLLGLQTNHSILNINESCNKINFTIENETIEGLACEIPTSSFELKDLETAIRLAVSDMDITFELRANNNTLKYEMFCNYTVDFFSTNNINDLLGFNQNIYKVNVMYQLHVTLLFSYIDFTSIHFNSQLHL